MEPTAPATLLESSEAQTFRDRLLKTTVTKVQLLRLAMRGFSATEASKVVGCAVTTAQSHYSDPDFRRAVLDKVDGAFADIDQAFIQKRKSLHDMIEDQAYRSCDDLISMLENRELHPSLRVKINQDFLNRVGESATVQKSMKVEPADLRHAASVAAEMDNVVEMKRKKG